jgi:hypothetical protein
MCLLLSDDDSLRVMIWETCLKLDNLRVRKMKVKQIHNVFILEEEIEE